VLVTVKLFATHRIGRFKEETMEYPANSPVGHVVEKLGIAPESLGIALLNGHTATLGQRLLEGDTLALFPLVAGG
jgi:molybdopterin converting factor small subunit